MNRKRFLIIAIAILLLAGIIIANVVRAGNLDSYALGVINDGSTYSGENANSKITRVIKQYDASSLTYEVKFKNNVEAMQSNYISILIDTSKSMGINDDEVQVKEKAIELVNAIYDNNVEGARISISTNTGVKLGFTAVNGRDSVVAAINAIEFGDGKQVSEGIAIATDNVGFSTAQNVGKYLFMFTDATDAMKDEVQTVQQKGINVASVLLNMDRESYTDGTTGESTVGDKYMIDNFDVQTICKTMSGSFNNVKITDVFADQMNKYFDFEVESVSVGSIDDVQKTTDGYVWNIPQLGAQTEAVLTFKFTLNDTAKIDIADIYHEIETNKNLNVEYSKGNQNISYDFKDTPIIVISEKYSITIQAVNEKSINVPVDGIDIGVKGTDEQGNVVFDDTLPTNPKGEIKITGLTILGRIDWVITPKVVNKLGYTNTPPVEMKSYNTIAGQGAGLKLEIGILEDQVKIDYPTKRNLFAKIPIRTQTFQIKVNLHEKNNSNMKIDGVELRLIQPNIDKREELSAIFESTKDGVVIFNPTVMIKPNKDYEYILTQMDESPGFEPLGNVTLIVRFDEAGNVIKAEAKYNDKAEAHKESDSLVVVNATNKSIEADTFKFELNLKDENSGNPIEGATYTIEAEGDYTQTPIFTGARTNKDGKILLDIPQDGNMRIKITEESPRVGYNKDKDTKVIQLTRKDGELGFIDYRNPKDLDADVDKNGNKVKVNLKSSMMDTPNLIRVQLVDSQENDIFVPNAKFTLTSPFTGESYTGTTNQDGIINFLVQAQEENDYPYVLTIDNTSIPVGYSKIEGDMQFTVHFGADTFIKDVWDTQGPIECVATTHNEDGTDYYTAFVKVLLDINEADAYNFKVKLVDETTKASIEGATYAIKITSGDTVREIKARKTDANGSITTRITPLADEITIEVQETDTKKGYKVDNDTQIITLRRNLEGTYRIIDQDPYKPDQDSLNRGAEVNGRDVIYNHTNQKKSGTDVRLNLHLDKKDKNEIPIASSSVKIYSDTLMASDGSPLSINTITEANGQVEFLDIRVPEIEIPGEREDYLYIVETETDADGNVTDKENTLIKMLLVFRYNEHTGNVELTDAEPTWGNRLVDNTPGHKWFIGKETPTAYVTDLYLSVYGNYDDVGNFSIDFEKTNEDGTKLKGAKYDIVVSRPDGTKLIGKDIEIDDSVEFEGIIVSKGTTIEITEKEAPIGYDVNGHTDIIEIKDVDITGEVTAEVTTSNYENARTVIKDDETQIIPIGDGQVKTCISVNLIDKELSTFRLGINTKDSISKAGVSNVTYRINTSKGAQSDTKQSDGNGDSVTLVGGNYTDTQSPVEYTIRQLQTNEYYKKLSTPITLNVIFNEFKEVDAEATRNANLNLPGYGTIWQITSINDETDVSIEILNEPQDKLNVEIQTLDNITSNAIQNVTYKVAPSVAPITGEGSTHLEVGYVSPNKTKKYTLTQTNVINTHKTMTQQVITVTYDNDGNISGEPTITGDGLVTVTGSGKTLNITTKLEPKVPFVIENIAYFGNAPVVGAQYEISGNDDKLSVETGANGDVNGLCGILGNRNGETTEEITYHVKQVKLPVEFASIEDFDIIVTYDENRVITGARLKEENKFVEVGIIQPSTSTDAGYNGNDKGIVTIEVKSYPALRMNIENVDRLNPTVKLAGTKYSVVSSINTRDDEVITNDQGVGVAYLDRTAINDKITYTIKEERPSALYQSMEKDVVIDVYFDENGFIASTSEPIRVTQGEDFASASKMQTISTPEDNFVLDVQIKTNKILKFNITAMDSQNPDILLVDSEFEGISQIVESDTQLSEQISTDKVRIENNGQGTLKMDKSLAGEKILYTIKQTRKKAGYQFPEQDIKIEVTFDSNGRMIEDSVRVKEGATYIKGDIVKDADGFNIDLTIVNMEIEQFGVNITAIDSYDDTIKLEGVNYETYLTIVPGYAKDERYTGNGETDINGETYIQFDKYEGTHDESSSENGEIRTLRIIETNLPENYREIRAGILVNIHFNTSGVITDVSVPGGLHSGFGWVADGPRFIEVTHTNYTVAVTIKHFPYMNFNMEAIDMYTGENLSAKYRISTHYGPGGYYSEVPATTRKIMEDKILAIQEEVYQDRKEPATLSDLIQSLKRDTSVTKIQDNRGKDGTVNITVDNVYVYTINEQLQITAAQGPYISTGSGLTGYTKVDYIGNGWGEFLEWYYTTNEDGGYEREGVGAVTEKTTKVQQATRDFYIYELEEPSSPIQYQKYRPRYEGWYYSKIIAKITVTYDDKGRIEKWSVEDLRSNNNIEDGFIELEKIDGCNLGVKIKYAPITEIEVTTRDRVSNEPLSNTRVMPYQNPEFQTRTSYEYRTTGYYTTDNEGKTQFTYWGANINKGQNEYHIDTSLMGYNGYFNSGLVKIKVAYDENGRISSADVLTTDENGEKNARVVGIEDNKLKIDILYNRKFNIKVNKADLYDANMKLTAKFDITSDKNDAESLMSSQLTTVGMVRPGETVEYTLSETLVPQGYVPMENLKFYVTFEDDGRIERTWSNSELFEEASKRTEVDKTRPATVQDLEVNIKNAPRFTVNLNLFDKFYNEMKLPNIEFRITNDQNDVTTGNTVTNGNGSISTYLGAPYRNKKGVIYTITQVSEIPGYKEKNIEIKLSVDFNENAKIENYTVIKGQEYVDIDPDRFQNERYFELNIKVTPKDLKLAIEKTDGLTNQPMEGVTFNVKAQEVSPGSSVRSTDNLVTDVNGKVMDVVDEFKESENGRVVDYTISEITVPNTYRKIQDVVIRVFYRKDGSIDYRKVVSNPSNVDVRLALSGKLQYSGDDAVHILLRIQNNNTYDLVIKDEDKNYAAGLGVEGTKYDISINGETLNATTDENGIAQIKNRTDKGDFQIRVAESEPGIGYKKDTNNDTTISVQKGEQEYSLNADAGSNPTNATVEVNEEYGIITVTFKNETKSSLTLVKDEIDVRYRITEKEKNADGSYSNEIEIGTDKDDTVPKEELHYDLGVTPQNKTIVYTFEELSFPQAYHKVGTFEVTVEFDMYGRIKSITNNNPRVEAIENPQRSNDIVVIVNEYVPLDTDLECGGCDNPNCPNGGCSDDCDCGCKDGNKIPYVVKVVSQDVNTNRRINDSEFDVNISIDGTRFPKKVEGAKTASISSKGYIIDNGVIKIDNVRKAGMIYIDVDQTKPAEGYIFGNQRTSGTVIMQVTYDGTVDSIARTPTLELKDAGAFGVEQVEVDDNNKVITIKVNNEPQVMMNIKAQLRMKDREGNTIYEPQEGIHYTIKSAVQLNANNEATDLNVRTKRTDEEGMTKVAVGSSYPGKRVLYTISQEESDNYTKLGDIVIYVEYNTNGLVKYYEVLSEPDDADVTGEVGEKLINLEVTNTSSKGQGGYRFVLNKHHIDDGEYDFLLSGVKFRIRIEEQYGEHDYEFEAVTDDDGKITSKLLNGYGTIKVTMTELETREGYKIDPTPYTETITRHKNGEFEFGSSHGTGFHFDQDNNTIEADPVNEPKDNSYTLVLSKMEKGKNTLITGSVAEFDITRVEKEVIEVNKEPDTQQPEINEPEVNEEEEPQEPTIDVTPETGKETIEVEVPTSLGRIQTDRRGQIRLEDIDTPDEPGTYKYVIKETKVPEGYMEPKEEVELELTFDYNDRNNMIVTNVEVLKGDADVLSTKPALVFVAINNEKKSYSLNDKEFAFDITKVDSETKEAITENPAIFRLTDENGNRQYVETSFDYGKLEIPYMQVPQLSDFKNEDGTMRKTVERSYELQEITPPQGYLPDTEPININIVFAKDNDGKVIIQDVSAKGSESIEVKEENKIISFNIKNKAGQMVTDEERGTYAINIAKVDADTGEPVTGHATFELTLEDGQIVTASTDENGNIIIKDIKVPATVVNNVGPYNYVIKETTAAEGYEIIDAHTLMEITFKEIIDETTGKGTGLYEIDKAVITDGKEATIKEVTEKQVNIEITNNFIDHRVHYEANDSEENKAQNIPDDQIKRNGVPLELTIKKQLPSRNELVFVGWATTADATEAEYQPGDMYEVDENVTLYAIWKTADSTITYDKNCEEEVFDMPDEQKKAINTPINLSDKVPVRDGYAFIGWATTADATEPEYQPKDEYAIDESVTLYAVWEEKLFITSDEYNILNAELEKFGRYYKVVYDTEKVFEYNEGDKYITKIAPKIRIRGNDTAVIGGTSVEDFKNNIKTNADTIRVTKKQVDNTGNVTDIEVSDDELIGSGMLIEFTKGKQTVKLNAIVPGDINNEGECADGRWSATDQAYLARSSGAGSLELKKRLEEDGDTIFALALDTDVSGQINALDVSTFAQHYNTVTKTISDLKQVWAKNTALSK